MEDKKLTIKNEEFAILETGGKQYIVEKDSVISIEKLPESNSKSIVFDTVLLHSKNGTLTVGDPYINLSIKAEILANEMDKKIRVFKFKPKTGFKKKQGHRQAYTTIKITSLGSEKSGSSKTEDKTNSKKNTKSDTAAKPTKSKKTTKVEPSKKKSSSEKKS